MFITMWTPDQNKYLLVKEVLSNYFSDVRILCGRSPLQINKDKNNKPQEHEKKSIDSVLQELKEKVKKSYKNTFSISIGTGVKQYENIGSIDVYACVFYDGKQYYQGISEINNTLEETINQQNKPPRKQRIKNAINTAIKNYFLTQKS